MHRSFEYCYGCEYLRYESSDNDNDRLFCAAVVFSVEDPESMWNTNRRVIDRRYRPADTIPVGTLNRVLIDYESSEFSPLLCMKEEHVTLRRLRQL